MTRRSPMYGNGACKRLTVRLPVDLHRRIAELAREGDQSVNEFVIWCLKTNPAVFIGAKP